MNNTNYFCELKCLGKNDFFIKFLSFTSVTLSISRLILSFSFSKDKNFSCVVTYLFCSLFHSSSIKMNLSSLFNFIFTFSHGFFRYVCSEQNCLFIPLFILTSILDSSNRYDQVGGGAYLPIFILYSYLLCFMIIFPCGCMKHKPFLLPWRTCYYQFITAWPCWKWYHTV